MGFLQKGWSGQKLFLHLPAFQYLLTVHPIQLPFLRKLESMSDATSRVKKRTTLALILWRFLAIAN
jgi:hypothetical protein